MKFTDGMWMTKDGFTVETPGEIYEVAADAEGLTLYCPYVAVQHRGNTLDGGLLTVRMTAGAAQHDRRASDEPPRRVRRHAALPAQPRHRKAGDRPGTGLLVPAQRRSGGARDSGEELAHRIPVPRQAAHVHRPQGHGPHPRPAHGRDVSARAARARRRGKHLRPGRALRPLREERPEHRPVERGRRQPTASRHTRTCRSSSAAAATACLSIPPDACPMRSAAKPPPKRSFPCPASRWNTLCLPARRRRTSSRHTPPSRAVPGAARLVLRPLALHLLHDGLR